PSLSNAKTLNEIFGDGILNTSWGMSFAEVKAKYPSGKKQEAMGTVRYFIHDGRTLFGIARSKNDYIGFIFNSAGKLSSVSIGMPSGTGDVEKTQNAITSSVGITPVSTKDIHGFPVTRWADGLGLLST
ncbi:MAG TPA: hypothetical protein VJ961_05250, partial [Mariprofundaceae bacterium]|nr:hypothetical protein [Mariprofundaceae bacterium]